MTDSLPTPDAPSDRDAVVQYLIPPALRPALDDWLASHGHVPLLLIPSTPENIASYFVGITEDSMRTVMASTAPATPTPKIARSSRPYTFRRDSLLSPTVGKSVADLASHTRYPDQITDADLLPVQPGLVGTVCPNPECKHLHLDSMQEAYSLVHPANVYARPVVMSRCRLTACPCILRVS